MMQKMKKISLMACSLLASAALVGGVCALPAAQSVSAETPTASFVSVDTTSKSDWQKAGGYGTDGYFIFGPSSKAYSNMYTEQGNDGKTDITVSYNTSDALIYYKDDATGNTSPTDSTAPISTLLLNAGQEAQWSDCTKYINNGSWVDQPDLYIPDTETTYPVRTYNKHADPYHDRGIGFTLRETGKIYVTVYVLDWNKAVDSANPITVGLFSGMQTYTFYAYGRNTATTLEEYYGTPLAKTTVTAQGAYVTFEIEGAGDYQVVAYYDNEDTSVPNVLPMMTGLFFDKVEEVPDTRYEPTTPVAPTEKVLVDTTSKSAWEANGYGTDGYLVFGGGKKVYSNLYAEPNGNNGEEPIQLYQNGDKYLFYNSACTISTDSDAPISRLLMNEGESASWSDAAGNTYWGTQQPDLYRPGTETTYPVRLTNGHTDLYRDRGIGFTLRETGKIYVTVYVLDWDKRVSADLPITVGLFSGIKSYTFYAYGRNTATTLEEYYGTPLAETTVTSQGSYVTFEIEEAGDYQIVAYYDNQGTDTARVNPMPTGLFFDKEMCAEVTSTSLSLEGDIGVNYYVGAHGQDLTDAILQVEYPNGTFDQVSAVSKNADGTYKFQVKVAAKDYAAKMQACLFTEDGTTLSRVFEYSAADYVASVLKAGASVYGEDLVALVTALDDYGKAAANLFYAQENTFTADLSSVTLDTLGDYQFALVGDLPSGVALTDFSLSLQSTTSLKIYFTATSLSGVVCKVDGVAVTPVKTGANEYCIEIANINAKDLDTNFVVSIGDCTLTLNTLSYAYRALEYSSDANLKVAMQALYLYNQAANQYFAKEA